MNTKEILKDIGARTNGDIYLGVVGPVRTGKSTFIKRFTEIAVIPNIKDEYEATRTRDELPQSGQGKQIMTTEPKFIPNTATLMKIDESIEIRVRLVDCVGYIIEDAKGYQDENGARMVKTPWFEDPIPFKDAAKIGTQKVIQEHSTIGVVVTTDGTIVDIERHHYEVAEKEVIQELINIGKPFIVIVNSKDPSGAKALDVKTKLENEFNVPVLALSLEALTVDDVALILKDALYEFPVANINVSLPNWVAALEEKHWLKASINQSVEAAMQKARKIKDVEGIGLIMTSNENITNYELANVSTANGEIDIQVEVKEGLYETIMVEIVGHEIKDKGELLTILVELSNAKRSYDAVKGAFEMAKITGYGSQVPDINDIKVERPLLVKSSGRYGVKVKASAPTYHVIRVDVDSTFEPIIGSKEQSEYLVEMMTKDYNDNPQKLFDNMIFGRKLGDVIIDGLNGKLNTLPDSTRLKVQQLIKTLANKGKTNLIAIVF